MPSIPTLNVFALASVGNTNQTEKILLMSFYTRNAMITSVKMPAKGPKYTRKMPAKMYRAVLVAVLLFLPLAM
jgi:hypothetical protein